MSTSQDTLTDNSQEHYQEPRTTTTADEDTIMDHKSSDDKVPSPNSPLSGRTPSFHAGTPVERSLSNRVEEKGGSANASGNANGSPAQGLPRPTRYSHGFFDPEVAHLRKLVYKIVGGASVILILVMWLCLPVYWGSLWKSQSYSNRLKVFVIDYDTPSAPAGTPTVGQAINNATAANYNDGKGGVVDDVGYPGHTTPKGSLGFTTVSPVDFPTVQDVMDAVADEKAWAAVVINQGATINLERAREDGDASYQPQSAVSFIYSQARNEQAAGNYILPIGQNVLQQALVRYAAQSASAYLARIASNVTAINALVAAPQTISPAVAFTMVNLHPYSATVAQAIGLVGFIYLLIFGFVLTMNWYAAREIMAPFLTTKALLVARIALPLFLYFWISLIFAMLNLPFKVPFGAKFTYAGGFFLWWIFLWVGMASLGLATEFFITILGPKFVAFSLIPLIIFNVSVVALPHELQPWFYRYQPAAPFFQLSRAVRVIIFDTKNVLGESIGVLLAWVALSIFTVTLTTWLKRRNEVRAYRAKEAGGVKA